MDKNGLNPLAPWLHHCSSAVFFLRAVPSQGSQRPFTTSSWDPHCVALRPCPPPLTVLSLSVALLCCLMPWPLFFLLPPEWEQFYLWPITYAPSFSWSHLQGWPPLSYWCVTSLGFPGGASGEESACQCRWHKRCRFDLLSREDPLEEGMATHSSILAWRIPFTEEPGRLQSIELHRIGHNWRDLACTTLLILHVCSHISICTCFCFFKLRTK